jgi:hypothetical protein
MKKPLLILAIGGLTLITLYSFSTMGLFNIEKQKYSVVNQGNGYEIRYYPPAVLATVYSTAKNYRELASPGFRKIANYIFGGNATGTKIAMTAPVHMDMGSERSSMSFVMPEKYELSDLPKPLSDEIHLKKTEGEYAAAIGFGGYASDSDIKKYSARLAELLRKNRIEPIGPFRFLGYNAPYQFIGRKNEIIVAVNWEKRK